MGIDKRASVDPREFFSSLLDRPEPQPLEHVLRLAPIRESLSMLAHLVEPEIPDGA